jgi:3-oxoacyl-[acyl-carrier protein] reductase
MLLTTKYAVALMNGDGASIINLSSVVSLTPPAAFSVYSATKAAIDAITRSLAQELGARKIRVNSLLPGVTETEGLRASEAADKSFLDYAISRTPLGRVGTVEDVASAALFLASDDSRWVTGEQLVAGGGIRV